MDYAVFAQMLADADRFLEAGRLGEAETAIYQLVIQDISDLDKSELCVKMAHIFDRHGKIDDALAWYDKGAAYEQIYCRYTITEKKAHYLSQIGRSKEAIPILETLLKQPYLTEAEKERIQRVVQSMVGKSMREWR